MLLLYILYIDMPKSMQYAIDLMKKYDVFC